MTTDSEQVWLAKTPSTPEDQSIGVLAGIDGDLPHRRHRPERLDAILHGTTVATNAVLEGKGARVGLLVTEGFELTLHLAKAGRPGRCSAGSSRRSPIRSRRSRTRARCRSA